jgi:hypothetical protein
VSRHLFCEGELYIFAVSYTCAVLTLATALYTTYVVLARSRQL